MTRWQEDADGTFRDVGDRRARVWTADELLRTDFPAPRFAVDGIVPEGVTFLGGAPKLGKSWLVLGLGIAVAIGGRALGSIPVEQGEVLYLALEDSPRRIRDRMRQVLDGDSTPPGLHIATVWERFDDEGGLDGLALWLEEHVDCRLVVIDVWPRVRPRPPKSGDPFQIDYAAVAPLQALANEHRIAVLVLSHTRKAEAQDFVDAITGTLGTAAAADTLLVVKRSRGQADAMLHVTGRDIEERELALRFDPAAGTWMDLGDASLGLPDTRATLLAAITTHGSLTPKQAAEVTEVSYELAKRTLTRMAHAGQVRANSGSYTPLDVTEHER